MNNTTVGAYNSMAEDQRNPNSAMVECRGTPPSHHDPVRRATNLNGNSIQSTGYLSIAPDVKVGKDVKLSKFINLYGCEIGDDTKIGAFVEIQKNAKVGERCKISSHTFICEGVIIEDEVFIGHNVTFVNDTFPRATSSTGVLQTEADWKVEVTS
jgi:UDP-3-O-[3-hydroxymyristoyl] glucosamine N-acyltransferase